MFIHYCIFFINFSFWKLFEIFFWNLGIISRAKIFDELFARSVFIRFQCFRCFFFVFHCILNGFSMFPKGGSHVYSHAPLVSRARKTLFFSFLRRPPLHPRNLEKPLKINTSIPQAPQKPWKTCEKSMFPLQKPWKTNEHLILPSLRHPRKLKNK